jgi:hypothetical protein
MASRRDAELLKRERSLAASLGGDGFVVMVGVRFGRLVGVMFGVQIVSARKMRVMAGRFVSAARCVFRRFTMVMRRAFVMLGCMLMVFGGAIGVSHRGLLVSARVLRTRVNSAIVRQTSDERACDVAFYFCEA